MRGSRNVSLLQGTRKYCYVSGRENGPLEKHHIYFGTGRREASDRNGFWVWLSPEWHRGTAGAHGRDGHGLDLQLKRDCQRLFEAENTREEFLRITGKSYLDK